MKLRIFLEAKKQFGGIEAGETLILYNEIFDLNTGIAFFSIDKKQWDVIEYQMFTGLKDENLKDIYEGDTVRIKFHDGIWGEILKEQVGVVKYDINEGSYIVEWELDKLNKSHMRLTCDVACETEVL